MPIIRIDHAYDRIIKCNYPTMIVIEWIQMMMVFVRHFIAPFIDMCTILHADRSFDHLIMKMFMLIFSIKHD